ncbi:MAG: TVP38/TMEM64 family protein [Mycoplasmatales bacterium]
MIIIAIISIILNIIIAILGVIPSIFITIFNVNTFGLSLGFFISLTGEVLGASISFWLYRRGFKQISLNILQKYPKINAIMNNTNVLKQYSYIIAFRLFPYMPSGIVTYGAAISTIDLKHFTIASTLGKIPAMILEIVIALGVITLTNKQDFQLNLIICMIIIIFVIFKITKRKT